ncbi:MAG: hypothetical protein A3A97_04340 [Candidatus Terrybacteria bacterium RIFCSPLOWO2_01_FULL_40_23]|uniref:Uncharacterized protein n=1 Tax=Candidatus Terrybacteria bacterium RIFCSPLOWO2_01_FULL_40_23 TaxID=1802366 RepID=A0A1G2PTF6_9BACT|nr:MAG: hypothetical protein A3A97_04340 [Candidatus Terrybacteria bacterium RIFCSPLOWO2_01_FULL_40_23]
MLPNVVLQAIIHNIAVPIPATQLNEMLAVLHREAVSVQPVQNLIIIPIAGIYAPCGVQIFIIGLLLKCSLAL